MILRNRIRQASLAEDRPYAGYPRELRGYGVRSAASRDLRAAGATADQRLAHVPPALRPEGGTFQFRQPPHAHQSLGSEGRFQDPAQTRVKGRDEVRSFRAACMR